MYKLIKIKYYDIINLYSFCFYCINEIITKYVKFNI